MMRQAITSPDLQAKLIPSWELGCRRITPGLPYLKAVQQPNVDVIRTDITKITKSGIETSDGLEHPADVIICATGFNTSFVRYEIVGRGGVSVAEMWRENGPEAYLGLCVAGLPNYFSK
jgi:hydroxyversicolorone monooxygenase